MNRRGFLGTIGALAATAVGVSKGQDAQPIAPTLPVTWYMTDEEAWYIVAPRREYEARYYTRSLRDGVHG